MDESKKLKVSCSCGSPINNPKQCWVIRRMDGGFSVSEVYFSKEGAIRKVQKGKKLFEDYITPTQGREWSKEHYLVECEIVEKKVIPM